jgi:hypothetical protein
MHPVDEKALRCLSPDMPVSAKPAVDLDNVMRTDSS